MQSAANVFNPSSTGTLACALLLLWCAEKFLWRRAGRWIQSLRPECRADILAFRMTAHCELKSCGINTYSQARKHLITKGLQNR